VVSQKVYFLRISDVGLQAPLNTPLSRETRKSIKARGLAQGIFIGLDIVGGWRESAGYKMYI